MSELLKLSPERCDLSLCSVEDAILLVGASFHYILTCHPLNKKTARELYSMQGGLVRDNPLAPIMNIVFNPAYGFNAWSLEANGKMVFSPGA